MNQGETTHVEPRPVPHAEHQGDKRGEESVLMMPIILILAHPPTEGTPAPSRLLGPRSRALHTQGPSLGRPSPVPASCGLPGAPGRGAARPRPPSPLSPQQHPLPNGACLPAGPRLQQGCPMVPGPCLQQGCPMGPISQPAPVYSKGARWDPSPSRSLSAARVPDWAHPPNPVCSKGA